MLHGVTSCEGLCSYGKARIQKLVEQGDLLKAGSGENRGDLCPRCPSLGVSRVQRYFMLPKRLQSNNRQEFFLLGKISLQISTSSCLLRCRPHLLVFCLVGLIWLVFILFKELYIGPHICCNSTTELYSQLSLFYLIFLFKIFSYNIF